MGYIKFAHRQILNILDNTSSLPKEWNTFVHKQTLPHNLIIKASKNKCFCTNCKHEFIRKKKINQTTKCPNCKNTYLIKRSNLKYYEFKDDLSFLDIINNTFVIRYFELKTVINALHKPHSSIVEYAREIISNNYYRDVYINERVSRCQRHIYIYHSNYYNVTKWRSYERNYSLIDYSIVFPNNIKKLLKNTEYQYSQLWKLAKYSKYIDLVSLLKNEQNLPQIEFLTKMKLYNLARCASEFKNKGSFQKIFGISKDFYPFMKRHNITYKQLEILKLLRIKNITKIRYLEDLITFNSTKNLEEISNYIDLNRFIKYSKQHHKNIDIFLYKDYLKFANLLGYNLKNNKYAFPKNLKEQHDKLAKQYKIHNQEIINTAIKRRSESLNKYTFKNKYYMIIPAPNIASLEDESKQQDNCVRTYAEDYATGISDIYFMRELKQPNKSLVTVEVQNNKIVQSRIKHNNSPTKEQLSFLTKWENKVLKGAA